MAILKPEPKSENSSMARKRRRASEDNNSSGGRQQVTISLLVGTPDTPAQLMQVAQSEILGVVDDDGIGIGDIDAVLDDGRRYEHIEFPVDEVHDEFFEFLSRHLTMTDRHAGFRANARNHPLQREQILDTIVDEIDLSAARELRLNGIADDLFREDVRFGDDGLPVGRRSRDDRQIARPHQRELQRTGESESP